MKPRFVLSVIPLLGVAVVAALGCGCAGTAQGEAGAVGTAAPALPWTSSGMKIGYVRSDVITKRYPDYKDADNTLRAENEKWLAESEATADEIRRKENELEELNLILSPEQKGKLEQELIEARRGLQGFRHETWYDEESRYVKRRRELMEPINARVNDAIWRVAQEHDLDIVFDTVAGNIVYVKPAFDITELVLEELQR